MTSDSAVLTTQVGIILRNFAKFAHDCVRTTWKPYNMLFMKNQNLQYAMTTEIKIDTNLRKIGDNTHLYKTKAKFVSKGLTWVIPKFFLGNSSLYLSKNMRTLRIAPELIKYTVHLWVWFSLKTSSDKSRMFEISHSHLLKNVIRSSNAMQAFLSFIILEYSCSEKYSTSSRYLRI